MKRSAFLSTVVVLLTFIIGTVFCGCQNTSGNITKFREAHTDNGFTYAISENGDLYTWGSNYNYLIGNGDEDTKVQTAPVKVLENVKKFTTNSYNICAAITENNELYLWGKNSQGEVGCGNCLHQTSPVKVLDNVDKVIIDDIISTEISVAAVTNDKELFVWGGNDKYGKLGTGTTDNQLTPVKIADNVKEINFDDSDDIKAYVNNDGDLYVWGNVMTTISGKTIKESFTPILLMKDVAEISNLGLYNVVIQKNRDLYMWGSTIQPGSEFSLINECQAPYKALTNVKEYISYADLCSSGAALTNDGKLFTHGYNEYGQLGDGRNTNRQYFKQVLDDVENIYEKGRVFFAITKSRELYAWGGNSSGHVGNGTTNNQNTPFCVLTNVKDLYIGNTSVGAVKNDNTAYIWGKDTSGISDKENDELLLRPYKIAENAAKIVFCNYFDIITGDYYNTTIIVDTDNNISLFGNNKCGQLGTGNTDASIGIIKSLSNIKDVCAGDGRVLVITKENEIFIWGRNFDGSIGNGTEEDQLSPYQIRA